MALEHHFVIRVDEDGVFFDWDALENRFGEPVFDTEKKKWLAFDENKKIENSYEIAASKLEEAITTGLDFMGGDE
jgi:hypothetical protein